MGKTSNALALASLVGVIPILYAQTAFSQTTLNCDLPGQPSCYSSGYSAGLVNKEVGCITTLPTGAGTPTQVNNYCSGYIAAQRQLK
jgi:hypothetical protein